MKVLVVGSGGREHAICWALNNSPLSPDLFIAPGNPGMSALGKMVPIGVSEHEALLAFAKEEEIDLTVIGPEQPLVDGIVDKFEAAGLAIFGPSAAAAELEGSKAFSKAFMARHAIPTAAHRTFNVDQYDEAREYLKEMGSPVVMKASGLAAGKGVLMCMTDQEAVEGLDALMKEQRFGDAGTSVVIEAFMEGEEASLFALTDGESYVTLAAAQDHKRIGDGDVGPNTGGMGAYAPAPIITPDLLEDVCRLIVEPTLKGMAEEGRRYRGVLYLGLMITAEGPKVVEYNCRFGDPETQVVLPLLKTDLLDLMLRYSTGGGKGLTVEQHPGAAACVVMASGGYPGSYPKGKEITGLEKAEEVGEVIVFHAGTRFGDSGQIETAGGRVLGITATGDELSDALNLAYQAIGKISFEGMQFRRDIGKKGLARL